MDNAWAPLAEAIARRQAAAGRGILVGINGPQGSGKSTACLFLEALLHGQHGLRVATLGLDDLYLTRAERHELARGVHPLLATRGVPGTHDVALGEAVITALLSGHGAVSVPRFDKAIDDRAPEAEWPAVEAPLDVLLFEGWCIGAGPEDEAALTGPINALEGEEDGDGRWRRGVSAALAGPYAALFARLDYLAMLRPPGFEQVLEWRLVQEAKLRAARGPDAGMSDAAIARFVMHYERLTRHMLAALPARADAVVPIDADHRVGTVAFRG
ncbi:kinase [Sphingomonas sp. XMGL2]|uniref:Kinase n=1 Tax=Sphingomonas quercus TaxID=2842451 RepID=A0ABS6BED9_9SPHN|nr:kinase [Sphingomonas quercus]